MKRSLAVIITLCVLGCSHEHPVATCPRCSNVLLDSSATITISRVLDGDTFEFGIGSDTIGIRILGIDAFETRHGSHLDSQAVRAGIDTAAAFKRGLAAKAFADSLLTNRMVTIYRDPMQPYADNFGRLLRYIFFSEGTRQIDYDSLLVAKGFALPE